MSSTSSPRVAFVAALLLVAAAANTAAAQASTVIFVRHAEKASSAADTELSEPGKARAADLAAALLHFRVDAVYVTEYRRTRETGDSVAALRHVTETVIPAQGGVGAYAAAVAAAVRKMPAGSTALVVGHSNTIAPAIAALGGPKIADLCDGEYGTLFVLELSGDAPRLLRAAYGAADSPEGLACARRMQLK